MKIVVAGFICSIFLLTLAGVQFVDLVEATPTVGGYWEDNDTVVVPLELTILSPKNTTYSSNNIDLSIRITKTETGEPMEVSHFYVSYDLDMGPYNPPSLSGDDIVNNDWGLDIYYSRLMHVSEGKHHLLVSVECFPENVSAYWYRTKTYAEVYFSVDTGSIAPSSPTPSPIIAPSPTPSPEPKVPSYAEGPNLLWNRTISEWNETAGQNTLSEAGRIIQTSDGGYMVAGVSNGSSIGDWYDWWLVKTDSNANVEWEKTFGEPYRDFSTSVIQTSDGGYAIAGIMSSQTSTRMAVVKIDLAGNTQWSQTYSDSSFAYIIQTNDGGYAIAGDDYGPVEHLHMRTWGPKPHIRLVKTDALGNKEWGKTYGVGTAVSVIQTSDGGYALLGSNFLFVKTDSSGELEWNRTYKRDEDDYAISVVQTNDGAFVLFGMLTIDRRCPGLIKIDGDGNELWAKNYLPERSLPDDMVGTRDGGYIFSASEDWTAEEEFVVKIVKVDSEGNISWVIRFAGNTGMPIKVAQTSDGGYAFLETRNLRDYNSWEKDYSAVWIVKTEKDPKDSTPIVSPIPTPTVSPIAPPSPNPEFNFPLGYVAGGIGAVLAIVVLIFLLRKK